MQGPSSIEDFKSQENQKFMLIMNPQYHQLGQENKSISINNMRYLYGKTPDISIDKDLRVEGDVKDTIFSLMDAVCESILEEGQDMQKEISELQAQEITAEKINANSAQFQCKKWMSQLVAVKNPPNQNNVAKILVQYIKDNMPDDGSDKWREFPRVLMRVFTANTYFFTQLLEMSVRTTTDIFENHHLETVYRLISQCIYRQSYRKHYELTEERAFSFNNKEPEFVWASVLLPVDLVKRLWSGLGEAKKYPTKDFSVPGILSGFVDKDKAIKAQQTNTAINADGRYSKILIRIKLDANGTHTLNDQNKKLKATCMLLKGDSTFTPEDQQVLFIEPRFRLTNYTGIEEPDKYHKFEVDQLSSVMQFENNPYDTDYLKELKEKQELIDSGKKFRSDLIWAIDGVPAPDQRKNYDLSNPQKAFFDHVSHLGMGAFGVIMLSKIKSTQKYFGLKVFRKIVLLKAQQIEMAAREIAIQRKFNHQNVLGIEGVFHDSLAAFIVVPVCEGGSLDEFLKHSKRFTERQTLFYAWQIIQGLAYMQKQNIVHRDLKAANVLIDQQGFLKLCDFGLSEENTPGGFLHTQGGSPVTMSPEMMKGEPHNHAVDYWALGIMMYQMIFGNSPFKIPNQLKLSADEQKAQNRTLVLEKEVFEWNDILNPNDKIPISDYMKDLIKSLLIKDPKKRLGANGADEVMNHPVFSKSVYNFGMITNRRVNLDIATPNNSVCNVDYTQQKYTQRMAQARQNLQLTDEDNKTVGENLDKFNCFNEFMNKPGDFDWQDNGKWDYLKN